MPLAALQVATDAIKAHLDLQGLAILLAIHQTPIGRRDLDDPACPLSLPYDVFIRRINLFKRADLAEAFNPGDGRRIAYRLTANGTRLITSMLGARAAAATAAATSSLAAPSAAEMITRSEQDTDPVSIFPGERTTFAVFATRHLPAVAEALESADLLTSPRP